MRTPLLFAATTAIVASIGSAGLANPSAAQICSKMIADGRGGSQSQAYCLCTYRVADAILDQDVKDLLFDAWYTGNNNMPAMERLSNPNRIKKQFRTMQRSLKANCG